MHLCTLATARVLHSRIRPQSYATLLCISQVQPLAVGMAGDGASKVDANAANEFPFNAKEWGITDVQAATGARQGLACHAASAVAEQQQRQHQQASRATSQPSVQVVLVCALIVAVYVAHVLHALVLVQKTLPTAQDPVWVGTWASSPAIQRHHGQDGEQDDACHGYNEEKNNKLAVTLRAVWIVAQFVHSGPKSRLLVVVLVYCHWAHLLPPIKVK